MDVLLLHYTLTSSVSEHCTAIRFECRRRRCHSHRRRGRTYNSTFESGLTLKTVCKYSECRAAIPVRPASYRIKRDSAIVFRKRPIPTACLNTMWDGKGRHRALSSTIDIEVYCLSGRGGDVELGATTMFVSSLVMESVVLLLICGCFVWDGDWER